MKNWTTEIKKEKKIIWKIIQTTMKRLHVVKQKKICFLFFPIVYKNVFVSFILVVSWGFFLGYFFFALPQIKISKISLSLNMNVHRFYVLK